ncbi:MAG TPA: hypothetical protein VGN70_07270 [Gammaproteobacteria bacterium]
MTDKDYVTQPDQYGLYVARISIYQNISVQLRSDETGEVISVQLHIFGRPGSIGYLEKSLKPGRYHLYDYHPFANVTIPLLTDTGYFDVRAGCFNYGGEIDVESAGGRVTYMNSVDLTELDKLPKPIAEQAISGRDICSAPLGKPNQRFSYASLKTALAK